MATVAELRTLNPGDYIEASNLYYKVLDVTNKGLVLTNPFAYGERPKGKWLSEFKDEFARIDHPYWNIIRKNSHIAKGIEKE